MTTIFNEIVPVSLNDRNLGLSLLHCSVRFILSKLREGQSEFYLIEVMRKGDESLEDFCTYIKVEERDFERLRVLFNLPTQFIEFGSFMQEFLANLEKKPNTYIQCTAEGDSDCNVHFKGADWNLVLDLFRFNKIDLIQYLTTIIHELRDEKEKMASELVSRKSIQSDVAIDPTETKEMGVQSTEEKAECPKSNEENEKKLEALKVEHATKLQENDKELSKLKTELEKMESDNRKLKEDLAAKPTQPHETKEDTIPDSSFKTPILQSDVQEYKDKIAKLEKELESCRQKEKVPFSTQFVADDTRATGGRGHDSTGGFNGGGGGRGFGSSNRGSYREQSYDNRRDSGATVRDYSRNRDVGDRGRDFGRSDSRNFSSGFSGSGRGSRGGDYESRSFSGGRGGGRPDRNADNTSERSFGRGGGRGGSTFGGSMGFSASPAENPRREDDAMNRDAVTPNKETPAAIITDTPGAADGQW